MPPLTDTDVYITAACVVVGLLSVFLLVHREKKGK